jgi:putative phosphotransacetylase
MINEEIIRQIVNKVISEIEKNRNDENLLSVTAELSNRHIHISQEDLEILFGRGYKLTKLKDLSQPGQFAAEETVRLIGPKGVIEKVRILGPVRKHTQIEISITDSYLFGIKAPIRLSGDIDGTPGIIIVNKDKVLNKDKGVIVALNHLHIQPELAEKIGLKKGDRISIEAGSIRKVIFKNVPVRSGEGHYFAFHIDIDEGNAAGLKTGDKVKILK